MRDAAYPIDAIRDAFPALRARDGRRPPAFFDGPGGTQVPEAVITAVAEYLASRNANTHGVFATSMATDRTLNHARSVMAAFVGGSPGEIVFGANMTTLTYALSRALGREWRAGDEVVVTEMDHQANVAPWRQLAADLGLRVRTVPIDPDGFVLDMDALERSLSDRTRLVAVGAASNAVGTVTDVRRAAELAHAAGALCFVDAVHLAPHRRIDVAALGCDFLACSAYKFFGPHIGVLWGRRELLDELRPYKVPPASDAAPERWESGTLNHEGIAGAAAAVEWIAALGVDGGETAATDAGSALDRAWSRIRTHEEHLLDGLFHGLAEIPAVRVHGPPPSADRTPTVAITVEGSAPEEVARRLARDDIYVWNGDFYAPTVIRRLGLGDRGGVVRIGLAAYTSAEDIDRLLSALRAPR